MLLPSSIISFIFASSLLSAQSDYLIAQLGSDLVFQHRGGLLHLVLKLTYQFPSLAVGHLDAVCLGGRDRVRGYLYQVAYTLYHGFRFNAVKLVISHLLFAAACGLVNAGTH